MGRLEGFSLLGGSGGDGDGSRGGTGIGTWGTRGLVLFWYRGNKPYMEESKGNIGSKKAVG